MRTVLRILLPCALAVLAAPLHVRAQPAPGDHGTIKAQASRYVDAGLKAQDAGEFDRAIGQYQKAYDLTHHPLMKFNMAQAHRLAGRFTQARALYIEYLDADPRGEKVAIARELIIEIDQRDAARADTAAVTPRSAADRGDPIDASPPATDGTPGPGPGPAGATPAAASAAPAVTAPAAPRPIHAPVWKWTLAASSAVGAFGVGFVFYSSVKSNSEASKIFTPGYRVTSDDCGRSDLGLSNDSARHLESACAWNRREVYGAIAFGVGSLGALVATIAMLREGSATEAYAGRSRRPQRAIALAPLWSPTASGAALSLTW
jgi:tetratricopeptide (TPR) repeat protein